MVSYKARFVTGGGGTKLLLTANTRAHTKAKCVVKQGIDKNSNIVRVFIVWVVCE